MGGAQKSRVVLGLCYMLAVNQIPARKGARI